MSPFKLQLMLSSRYIIPLLFLLCVSACTTVEPLKTETGIFPQSAPIPESSAELSAATQEILFNALSLKGIKYKYGGRSPETGFDCSGFVRYVFQRATDMKLPHNTLALSQLGETISAEQLLPGDLVFFNTMSKAFSHVGIYLGDNRFIHAPSSGGTVHVVDMTESYWSKRFNGARRIAAQ